MTTLRSFTSVVALLTCATTAAAQAPVNDDCANRTVAVLGSNLFDLTGATTDGTPLDPMVCDMSTSLDDDIYQEVWFNFTAPSTDNFTIDTDDRTGGGGSVSDTRMAIYNSTACPADALLVLACDDDQATPFDLQAGFSVDLVGGNTYKIRVGTFAFDGTTGIGDLFISVTPPPPANDTCVTASPAVLGLNTFDNTSALDSGFGQTGATCGFTSEITGDVWYTFTPGMTASYDFATLDNGSGAFDTKFTLYDNTTPTCPPLVGSIVDCDDFDGPGSQSFMRVNLTAGTPYLIRVGGDFGTTGSMDLSIALTPPPPANNDCAGAVIATLGQTPINNDLTTTTGAALDPLVCDLDASADDRIYNDLWFLFTAPSTSNFTLDTDNGTDYDTRIAVYNQNTCPDSPANVIACDDDTIGTQSEVLVDLVAGTQYLIRVGSDDPLDRGIGNLTIDLTPPPPANDDCANRTVAILGSNPFTLDDATTDGTPLDPNVCDMSTSIDEDIYQEVWFNFTAPSTDSFTFDTDDRTGGGDSVSDTRMALYDSTACPADPLLVLACDDDQANPFSLQAGFSVDLVGGNTYKIRVGTFAVAGTTGPGDLFISLTPPPPTPPANDDCANATPITMFGTYAYDTTLATTDGLDLAGFCDLGTFGDEQIYDDVWFAYTPTVSGCTYISTLGLAGYDSRMAIYTGATCPNDPATVLACVDDEVLPIATPFEAGLDVTLSAGTTYLIRVGNFNATSTGGAASILIASGPQADVNNTSGSPQLGAPGCAAGPAFNEFCFGDGGNQMGCTNCPCTNEAPIGSGGGCLNSGGTGIRLTVSGDTSVSLPSGDTTDLRFGAVGAPATAFCILNSGDALAPGNMANPCFGMGSGAQAAAFDGLRCAITNTRRHGGRSADGNGDVGVTNNPWGGEGGPPVGIAQAGGGFAAGQTRFFQIINRDDALAVCMRALNTSQAVEVTFTP